MSAQPPPLHIRTNRVQWFRPNTLQEMLKLKAKYQDKVRVVAGNLRFIAIISVNLLSL